MTLTANNTSGIPVIGITYALGDTLAHTPGLRMRVFANTERKVLPTANVIAERTGANDDNVVMAGAHLDSVLAGPGINDNGSGSAVLLEIAQQLAHVKLQNTVRLAWWTAEESGLVGSTHYVNSLSEEELGRIALYMNFDMVGSPNYIFMTQDADQSSFDGSGRRSGRLGSDRGSLRVLLHEATTSPTTTRRSTDAATIRRSSSTTFRPAASSPARRFPRPPSRRESGAEPWVRSLTRATTRPATPSPTTTIMR